MQAPAGSQEASLTRFIRFYFDIAFLETLVKCVFHFQFGIMSFCTLSVSLFYVVLAFKKKGGNVRKHTVRKLL